MYKCNVCCCKTINLFLLISSHAVIKVWAVASCAICLPRRRFSNFNAYGTQPWQSEPCIAQAMDGWTKRDFSIRHRSTVIIRTVWHACQVSCLALHVHGVLALGDRSICLGRPAGWLAHSWCDPRQSFDDQKYPAVKIHASLLCNAHATRLFDMPLDCLTVQLVDLSLLLHCSGHAGC